ncbi:PREDICTED: uncharacterized protein LOC104733383 [Camelina sativa]|uniref:Uncharacterized protein LOC104733383 n=1 Tax=Camelina sativa TaxID=90675 RepID=A0ABM1QQN3_CAMSA|nr:PREDICTED: uncharacterized protein LOC104733383 [Camelina sativa]
MGLSPVRELSEREQHEASLADVYDQLGEMRSSESKMKDRLETMGSQMSSQIESLGNKLRIRDQRLEDLGRKLDLVLNSLPGIETVREVGGSSQSGPSRFQENQNQVRFSPLEPCRSNIRPGLRENLMKNVEMAVFDGVGVYSWVARVERFFRLGGYNDEEKLALVSVSLSGEALSWYNWVINTREFNSWMQFKSSLMLRFGNLKIREPSQSLFCIKQTSSLADYIQRFEDLSSQVSGLDEHKLEGIFLNGLTQEMQELVHMQKPRNLDEMVAEARAMESSIMRRLVRKEPILANKENQSSTHEGNSLYNTNTWKTKTLVTDTIQTSEKQAGRVEQRPRRHSTNAELDEKRKKGLCFKCDGPWSKDHKCPNKELRVLTVLNGYEVEVLNGNVDGIAGPTTTKVRGSVGKEAIVIMLDSGATHNFISLEAVKKLKLKCRANPDLNIKLGTGILVNGLGVCERVTFSTQGLEFTTDFIVLELGQVDVILGVYWLRTLGECRVNWEKNEMSFLYKGKMVSLKGEPDLLISKMSLKSLSSGKVAKELCNNQVLPAIAEPIPERIQEVLAEFDCVFVIPTSLPPIRGREHSISLSAGTTAVSVRPYRYPHAQKEVMEKMVGEMLEAGIIRPSQSPFSSPVLLVKKKDSSWHFCVDYRALNRATIPDKFLIPIIDQLLDELNGSVLFSNWISEPDTIKYE